MNSGHHYISRQSHLAACGGNISPGNEKLGVGMKKAKVITSMALALGVMAAPAAALATLNGSTTPGSPFTLCRTQGTIPDGRYMVNNNNFAGKPECLTGRHGIPGFRVSESDATSRSPGSDAFPDIFSGCSWGICSPHSWLPDKAAALGNPKTTWHSVERARGTWGAGYDTFFDPRPRHDGQAAAEMMIWLNSRNAYNPAGKGWPVARLDGARWYVLTWETSNGHQRWRYVQFRRYTPTWNVTNLALGPFVVYLKTHDWIRPNWYLLNVEAGFEIWNGGTGLTATYFSVKP
jgi:hypothetical protein